MDKTEQQAPSVEDIDRAPLYPSARRVPSDPEEFRVEYNRLWDRFTEIGNENFQLKEENARLKREKQTTDVLNRLAAPYANNTFRFMCGYCAVVGGILLLDGFKAYGFDLEEGLMEFLVGSTAVTVIGLVATVLTGVFVYRPK